MQSAHLKKIVAISGSLRPGSSNYSILRFFGEIAPESIYYVIYDGLAALPHFDPGLDNDGPPVAVAALRELLIKADGIIICTPEYAYGVPGSLKNALDWTVSSSSLVDKPVMLITASTNGEYAHAALLLILGALSANVLKDAALLIPFIRSKMDEEGNIADEATKLKLIKALDELLKTV